MPLKERLYGLAWRYLKCSDTAADVVQEVLLKVWRSQQPLAQYRNLTAWCLTLTRNQALDALRKNPQQVPYPEKEHLLVVQDNILEQKQLRQYLRKQVAALPPRQREAVELRDFEQLSYAEIADVLETEVNQVKANLHKGRQAIRKSMKEWKTWI